MLDARYVRENVEAVRRALKKRGYEFPLADFLAIDEKRISILKETEELRSRRNLVSEEIGKLKRQKADATAQLEEMKGVSDRLKELDEELKDLEAETKTFLLIIPNIPHESVPEGRDEDENVEVRRWGNPRQFDFE